MKKLIVPLILIGGLAGSLVAAPPLVERVTTIAPYPRGLELVDGDLYVLCRGRVRGAGGVVAEIDDQAGTIYIVDPEVTESIHGPVGDAVRHNGRVFARPTDPPFRLWDRTAEPPWSDRVTDRPYCALRFDKPTQSFYICAFSGIDKPRDRSRDFSKNLTDGLLRYDLRTGSWSEVERHDMQAGGNYPHHDPAYHDAPHGWLNGPDNCLVVGRWLYAAAKDNSRVVRYDLGPFREDPEADAPGGEPVLDRHLRCTDDTWLDALGPSALAWHDGFLYVAYRTSSIVIRIPVDANGEPRRPLVAEVVARFAPFDPADGSSAEITDLAVDSIGRVYVMCAQPSRVHRFRPDPQDVYDARDELVQPAWLHLAERTGNPRMKSENILIDDRDRLFVTSGDGYDFQAGADGTVYRVTGLRE